MNKKIMIGLAAFGGLLLIMALLPNTPKSNKITTPVVKVNIAVLPDNLPDSIPIYSGSEIIQVQDIEQEGVRYITVSLSANTTKSEANTWYRNAMSQNGWSIKSDRNIAGYQIIQAENENLYTSIQAASGNEPGQVIVSQQIQIR